MKGSLYKPLNQYTLELSDNSMRNISKYVNNWIDVAHAGGCLHRIFTQKFVLAMPMVLIILIYKMRILLTVIESRHTDTQI